MSLQTLGVDARVALLMADAPLRNRLRAHLLGLGAHTARLPDGPLEPGPVRDQRCAAVVWDPRVDPSRACSALSNFRSGFPQVPVLVLARGDAAERLKACREFDRGFGVRLANTSRAPAVGAGLEWLVDVIPSVLLARLFLTARPVLRERPLEFLRALTRILDTPNSLRSLSSGMAVGVAGTTLRTVERRLKVAGWPTPDRLRMWIELFHVTYVAQLSGRSATASAKALGGDGNTVYRLKRRLLGSGSAADLSARDALDSLARVLFAEHRILIDATMVGQVRSPGVGAS